MIDDSLQVTDEQLLRDLRAGGENKREACAELHRRYLRVLVHRLHGVDRSVALEDCEDAVQTGFGQLWEGREHYRGNGSLPGYLTTCARHHLVDLLRQRRARQLRDAAVYPLCVGEPPCSRLDVHTLLWTHERDERVRQAVRELPREHRQAVEQVYLDGHRHHRQTTVHVLGNTTSAFGLGYHVSASDLKTSPWAWSSP